MSTDFGDLRQVLILGDFASLTGGQAKVAIDSAVLLAEAGLRVTFFAACAPVDARLRRDGITVTCLGQPDIAADPSRLRALARGLWNRDAARRLAAEIAALDPDRAVIHCHGWAKALSPSIGPVLAQSPVPVLYTLHEYFLACPNGGFFDYETRRICARDPLGPACLIAACDRRGAHHKAWRLARAMIARGPGRLPGGLRHIAVLGETQRATIAPYLPAGARLHHLPNPVAPGGPGVDAARNGDFVFVGRLSPEKGAPLFAAAARKAVVRAVFVGDGEERSAVLRANPDATVTGWLPPEEVQHHLSRARALVLPSLWSECQPLVSLEALLRGVPVVTGRWCAAAEEIEDGRNGVLVDRPDRDAFAEALLRVQSIGAFDSQALAQKVAPAAHLSRLARIYGVMRDGSAQADRSSANSASSWATDDA